MRRICLGIISGTIFACLVMTSNLSMVCSAADTESGWGDATLIEAVAGLAEWCQVAVDESGNAVAVWRHYDGAQYNIMSNRYVVGWGWGTPMLIETDTGWDDVFPQVAIHKSGNAVAVWRQWDGAYWSIMSSRYIVGWGWSTPTPIETEDAGNADRPQVATDGSGNATAVWRQWDGAYWSIMSNRYTAGLGWGDATLIETEDAGHAGSPHVAVDGSGNAVAVWSQSDGSHNNIYSNRYVVGTGWGDAMLIETNDTGNAEYPQVAVDGSGNAVVVWHQWDGTRYNIWSNQYIVGKGWDTAALIESDDVGSARIPRVAVDESGNAIAVWYQYEDLILNNVWSNRYVVGTGWGTATLIEIEDEPVSDIKVAVDGSGNAVAVWSQFDGSHTSIWSNRYVVGTGWGDAMPIEVDSEAAYFPNVAVDGSGNAIVVWEQYDGTHVNIWSNRYVEPDTTPPPLSLVSPADGMTTEASVVTVSGTTEPGVSLVVNGISVAVESDGSFSCEIALVEGENAITATATDASDNSATVSVSVTYVNPIRELEEELSDALDELNTVKDELNETRDELDAIQDDLNAAEDELTSTSDDLESVKSQNLALMAVLAIVAILAVVMSVMFMSLRKKIAGMEVKAADEEPPPPQS